MTKKFTAALCALLVAASTLAVVAQPAAAHSQTKTVQRCAYDPFAGQQCWTETVSVSHVHRCGAGMTGTYPNCYPIPPVTQPVCPAGMTGTPPNCYPPPPATTQPPPPPTTQPPECPAGQTGTPPNCKTPPPPECPAGQTGTPPNCKTDDAPDDSSDSDSSDGGGTGGGTNDGGGTDGGDGGDSGDSGDSTEPDSTQPDSTQPDSTQPDSTDNGGGTGTRTVSKDPCGDWASATRDALHTYGADGVPNITPPPAVCGVTALQLGRFLNTVATSDPLDQVVLSAAESEAIRNALDALGSEYNKYITTWDSLTTAEKVLIGTTACLAAGLVVSPPAALVLGPPCTLVVGLADAWLPRPTVEPDGDDSPSDDSSPDGDSGGDSGEQDPSDQKNLNNAKDQNGGDSDKFSDAAYTEAIEDFNKTGDVDALTDFLNEWVCHHGNGIPTTGTCE